MKQRNRTQYIILIHLAHGDPMTAHDIYKKINDVSVGMWSESEGQIYPALQKLLQQELCTETITLRNNRKAKVYTITEQGFAALQNWLTEPAQPCLLRDESLLKLCYGYFVDDSVNIQHLQRRLDDNERGIADLQQKIDFLKQAMSDYKETDYWIASIEYGIMMLQTDNQWCQQFKDFLNNNHTPKTPPKDQ